MSDKVPGSDPIYKRLYAFPKMVADLLRSVLPAAAFDALDLSTLDKVPASYVGNDFRQRHGDAVWRVYAAGRWTYVLVLLEFQSSSDAAMALRVLEYTVMLYKELLRTKRATLGDLPPVLPIVLYNGESPWSAEQDVADLIGETGPALLPYQPSQRHLVLCPTQNVASVAAGSSAARRVREGVPGRTSSGRNTAAGLPAATRRARPQASARFVAFSRSTACTPSRNAPRARTPANALTRCFVWDRALLVDERHAEADYAGGVDASGGAPGAEQPAGGVGARGRASGGSRRRA